MDIKETVKRKYGQVALNVVSGGSGCCCGPKLPSGIAQTARMSHEIYEQTETSGLPAEAVVASLGCGNPTALAELKAGETVLDLGSGGGIDVFLSAKRVGPAGKVFGLDMTDEMLALARENHRKSGLDNVEFLKGEIENVPLRDNSVDVIISNCVINLSVDKRRVLREAFRVLKPNGRFAVSDVVLCGYIPAALRNSPELWSGCVAGAMLESDYTNELASAGFAGVGIEPTRVFRAEDVREFLSAAGEDAVALAQQADGKIMSAFVRATKPANAGALTEKGRTVRKIQILGTGCARCRDLTKNAERAVQELAIEAEIEKVMEIQDIIKFQILMTPGLVIDGQVKAAGRVPGVDEIKQLLVASGGK